ncbi:hypothetical protein BDW59DRAFT_144961 [Aspergillus cavernicola]|uniref:Uncharacterized protein n=1 Tax=Aspergillus cavernicola TaxID=176166 RepID=A0ABR4IFS5_9EURO
MSAEIVGRTWVEAGRNGMNYGLLNLVSTFSLERERPAYLRLRTYYQVEVIWTEYY